MVSLLGLGSYLYQLVIPWTPTYNGDAINYCITIVGRGPNNKQLLFIIVLIVIIITIIIMIIIILIVISSSGGGSRIISNRFILRLALSSEELL